MDLTAIYELKSSEDFWFWVSIISLLMLAVSEVVARKIIDAKDEYISVNAEGLSERTIRRRITKFTKWEDRWFWLSIASLVMLGISEVISHRFASSREEFVTLSEQQHDSVHESQLADVQVKQLKAENDLSELKIQLLNSQKQLADLQIELRQAEIKLIYANQRAEAAKKEADQLKSKVNAAEQRNSGQLVKPPINLE